MGLSQSSVSVKGFSQSLSSQNENCTTFNYPAMTGHNMGEITPMFMWGKKKNEHKVFSHRVRAECKPPKCFILRHTCLPWLVGNPVNVGMTSSVHGCSAVTAGHCNDLSLNVFLRHVPHVTANYAGVKEASKHSSLNVMALVQFYFIKLLQYKTEVKQFF